LILHGVIGYSLWTERLKRTEIEREDKNEEECKRKYEKKE
jgi:hypothetical protein